LTSAVVDASVIVNALTSSGARAETAIAALSDFDHLVAPHLLDLECASVWARLVRGRQLARRDAAACVMTLAQAPIDRLPTWPLSERIWELTGSVTSYDATYVVLAETLEIPLLTSDRRLARTRGFRCEVRIVAS
jgi:predicted nucleic acid-binding protein